MEIIQGAQVFNFNYAAYDQNNSLFVQFRVYDVSSGTPVFLANVTGQAAGFGVYTGTYSGSFGQSFLVIGAVFTDGSFTALNGLYGPDANCFQILSAGGVTFLPFNYATYDANPALFIRASVSDLSSGSPVFVQNVVMHHLVLGVYFGSFSGVLSKTYMISSAVYTDGTYSTIDFNRAPAAESFDCISATVVVLELDNAILVGQSLDAVLEANCDCM